MEFKFEQKTFNINERLRVGIISDSQLSPVRRKKRDDVPKQSCLIAFRTQKTGL